MQQIFIATDGPRRNNTNDLKACEEIAQVIIAHKAAGLGIEHLNRDQNLGCQMAMSGAISWFFEQVDYGIIVEDDCLISPSFISFAAEMLERYRDTPEIMHISGSNFLQGKHAGPNSYYFSAVPHIWGWATWKRAWQHYDAAISPDIIDILDGYFNNKQDRARYKREFENTASGKLDSWGYRWFYSIWKRKGVCITPSVNLVSNVGFGEAATHTVGVDSSLNSIRKHDLTFPLLHPTVIKINHKADNSLYQAHYKGKVTIKSFLYSYIFKRLKALFPNTYAHLVSLLR